MYVYIYIYINVKKKIKTKIIHINIQIFKYPSLSAYLDNFSSINGSIIIFIYL